MSMTFVHTPWFRTALAASGFALMMTGGAVIPMTPASAACLGGGWLLTLFSLADTREHAPRHA